MNFVRKDTPTIMDGMVVRYQLGDFEINASRNGVSTYSSLPLCTKIEDIHEIQNYLLRAFLQFKQLEPNSAVLYGRNKPLSEEQIDKMLNGQHERPAPIEKPFTIGGSSDS